MTDAAPAGPRPRRRWIWVIVAIVTSLAVVMPVDLRSWLKAEPQHEKGGPTVIGRPITALQVNAPSGSVTISAGRPGQVTMQSTLSWLVRKPTVSRVWRGRTLVISARCPQQDPFEDCQVSLNIWVPADLAVRATVGAGSVAVARLSGPLHLAATSGVVMMTDVSGPVWATATSGSIGAPGGLDSQQVDAAVGSGHLSLRFDREPTRLVIAVGSGSGRATVPPGTHYRVTGNHGPGLLAVGTGVSEARSPLLISASVGTGTIRIGYPPGAVGLVGRAAMPRPSAPAG